MDLSQIIFLLASLIAIAALFAKDMLILQSIYLLASILFLISSIFFNIPIMMAVNICYISVNLYQIIRIHRERSTAKIPHDLLTVYNSIFSNMHPGEFIKLINLGERGFAAEGEYLYRQGEMRDVLILVLQGDVRIESDNKIISQLHGNFLLGEMRYLTRKPISADVIVHKNVNYISWTYEVLDILQKRRPDIRTKLIEVIGKDLIHKIQKQPDENAKSI